MDGMRTLPKQYTVLWCKNSGNTAIFHFDIPVAIVRYALPHAILYQHSLRLRMHTSAIRRHDKHTIQQSKNSIHWQAAGSTKSLCQIQMSVSLAMSPPLGQDEMWPEHEKKKTNERARERERKTETDREGGKAVRVTGPGRNSECDW